MAEIIMAIALLCQVHSGSDFRKFVKEDEIKCQKYFVKCLSQGEGGLLDDRFFPKCIEARK